MSARRIAREMAVIMMPQLPKDKKYIEKLDFDRLLCRSVQLLSEHARQCLSEANGYLVKAEEDLQEIELEHPQNSRKIADIQPVSLNSQQLREQIELVELAMNLVSEALDIPEMVLASDLNPTSVKCKKCDHEQKLDLRRPAAQDLKKFVQDLISAYLQNHELIDQIIQAVKTRWRIDRMVSIDRDILRLACAEAFFMPDIPLKVAINEAVELTHRFADRKAARFINGILADLSGLAEEFRQSGELKIVDFSSASKEDPEASMPLLG